MNNIFKLSCLFICTQIYAFDLPQNPIKAYECDSCSSLVRETLKTHWKIAENPLSKAESNIQKSYSYYLKVTALQLQQGINLPIHAPGPMLKITSLQKNKSIPDLELKSSSSQFMSLKEASSLYAQDEAIDKALKIDSYQTMLQIKPELSTGNFILKSKNINPADADFYLIHVFEKYSSVYLNIEPTALHYQYGDQFKAVITLKDNNRSYPIDEMHASLRGPHQQVIPLKIKEINSNQFQASALLSTDEITQGENWYIDVEVMNESDESNPTYRSGRAAFSYSIPSASLVNIKKISSKPLTLRATVEVATASRYGLQSVLYMKNTQGNQIPVETAQSSQWLEPGIQTITLIFDNSTQIEENLAEVGYLRLTDFGQFKMVYQYDELIKLSNMG